MKWLQTIKSKIVNKIRNNVAALTIAFSNVEKNTLTQEQKDLADDLKQEQKHSDVDLATALQQGIVTQDVRDLRYRNYKMLRESKLKTSKIVGYDSNGMPIVQTFAKDLKENLKGVKIDDFDSYPLDLVIYNEGKGIGRHENISEQEYLNNSQVQYVVDGVTYYTTYKQDYDINVVRDFVPSYYMEMYVHKLNVRKIDTTKRLLEFYVTKYRTSEYVNKNNFISMVEKTYNNPTTKNNAFDIKAVFFQTNERCIGALEFMGFEYDNLKFDKIVEFDGNYVIKYIGDAIIENHDMLGKFKEEDLEKKYERKEQKKVTI